MFLALFGPLALLGIVALAPAQARVVATSVTIACSAPPNRLVSWWTGDGHESDIVGDTLLHRNGATYTAGLVGKAIHTDGVSSYAVAPADQRLATATRYSVEFWFRPSRDIVPGEARAFFLLSNGPDLSIGISNDDSQLEVRGPLPRPASGPRSWIGGTWYHIALTFDHASGYVLYVDGAAVGSSPSTTSIMSGAAMLNLGWEPAHPQVPALPGDLDEITIYDAVLTPAQVATIAGAAATGKCKYRMPFVGVRPITQAADCPPASTHWQFRSKEAIDYVLLFESVYASQAGEVVFAGRSEQAPGLGWQIKINHPDGNQTVYAHLQDEASLFVQPGERVIWGQLIATSGASSFIKAGAWWIQKPKFAAHLHFHMIDANQVPVAIPRTIPTTKWASGTPDDVCTEDPATGYEGIADGPPIP